MTDKKFDAPASPNDITSEEIEIAQWRVDVTAPGRWKIDEIYAEYWEGQDDKKNFGKKFKAAVEAEIIKGIYALKHDDGAALLSSDHQQLYEKP